jgi:N-acetylglucosamine kinase-like BadF-type ATPase
MIAYGRNEADVSNPKEWVTGGNGALVDSGSGYMLGMDAIRAAFAAADGMGPNSVLLNSVLDYIGGKEASDIVPWLYKDHEWGRIASLGRLVFDAVDQNDEVALNILRRHVEYLVRAATTIIKRLEYNPKESLTVVLNGGLFNSKRFFQLVNEGISSEYPFVQCILPKVNPAHGAALLAKQQAAKQ